jgi:hypothetical protein
MICYGRIGSSACSGRGAEELNAYQDPQLSRGSGKKIVGENLRATARKPNNNQTEPGRAARRTHPATQSSHASAKYPRSLGRGGRIRAPRAWSRAARGTRERTDENHRLHIPICNHTRHYTTDTMDHGRHSSRHATTHRSEFAVTWALRE